MPPFFAARARASLFVLLFIPAFSAAQQVAAPTFNPAPGTYLSPQSVAISTTTSGASIRYTVDGSIPSETAGTLYSGPVSVSVPETINAIAYASGMTDSSVSQAAFTITPPALTASINQTGNFYQGETNAVYTIVVSNASGAGYTAGIVNLYTYTQAPSGLSPVSISGTGWTCSFDPVPPVQGQFVPYERVPPSGPPNACSRSDSLAPGGSYPPVTVTLSVAANATSPQVFSVEVWGGGPSNIATFTGSTTITAAPSISSLNTSSSAAGTILTITGTGFGSTQGSSLVTFNGASAGTALQWSDTSIIVVIPSAATTGNVAVTVNGINSAGAPFTVLPSISSLSPASGQVGTTVTITGSNFGAAQGSGTVNFNGTLATPTSWSTGSITAPVPPGATTGNVVVTASGSSSSGMLFAIPPILSSVSPGAGAAGTQITLAGSNFGPTQGGGTVWLGTTYATIVSWSNTQIVATITANSQSGTARVQQQGASSNAVPFVVNTPNITNVSPASGLPGTQVTITGTGFGAQQGGGQVWLGTANGTVQSWSDTQILALLASGAASGNAQVLHNGVVSNAVTFSVNTTTITSVSPISGPIGTSVTISGSGFGTTQGTGAVQVGSVNGQIVSWSDSQIIATVAPGSLSGIVRVTQNAIQSNSKSFIVTVPGGSALTLTPDMLNMMVGDTHTIQALNSSNQPVTGLTWTSSDPTIVSLSTDDPPVLTAVAAGHVTITAGGASADVTVSSVALAPGTVLWSNPVNGAAVDQIIPAVPSAQGVADVFAVSGSYTPGTTVVHAITADGATAWTADLSDFESPWLIPDFQGGLLVVDQIVPRILKLDGITGRRYPAYTPPDSQCGVLDVVAHPDGTVFADQEYCATELNAIIGIDPTSGTLKFQVPMPTAANGSEAVPGHMIIAGDGFAYFYYFHVWAWQAAKYEPTYWYQNLGVLRVSSSGASNNFLLREWDTAFYYDSACNCYPTHAWGGANPSIITNADTGVFLAWYEYGGEDVTLQLANITASGVSLTNGPSLPHSSYFPYVSLDLQAQDGSFIGDTSDRDTGTTYAFSFDTSGNLHWVVPNVSPAIATADGGFIGSDTSGSNQTFTFDQYGNATGQLAGMPPVQSWTGEFYQYGSVEQLAFALVPLATTFWALAGANASENNTAAQPLPDTVKAIYDVVRPDPLGAGAVERDINYQPYQGNSAVPSSKGVIIKEKLIYSYGQKPQASTATGIFQDVVGTEGKGPFGLTQQFFLGVPGYRDYRVQIVPCSATNTFGTAAWQNINIATSQSVLINQDAGSTNGRTCR